MHLENRKCIYGALVKALDWQGSLLAIQLLVEPFSTEPFSTEPVSTEFSDSSDRPQIP
jgi:hypothetical protein